MKKLFLLTVSCLSIAFAKAQVDFQVYATAASTTPTLVVGKDGTTTVNGLLKVTDALKLPSYSNSYFSTAPNTNGILAYNTDAGLLMLATGGTWTSITKGVDTGKIIDCASGTYSFTFTGFSYTGTAAYEIGMDNLSDASLALANGTNAAWNSGIFTATANPAPSTFVAEVTPPVSLPSSLYTYIPPTAVPSIVSLTFRGTPFAFSTIQPKPLPSAMLGTNVVKDYNASISSVSTNKITYSMSYYPIPLLKTLNGNSYTTPGTTAIYDNIVATLVTPTYLTTTPSTSQNFTGDNGNSATIPASQALNLYYAHQAFNSMNKLFFSSSYAGSGTKYQAIAAQWSTVAGAPTSSTSPMIWLGYGGQGQITGNGWDAISANGVTNEFRNIGNSFTYKASVVYNRFNVMSFPPNMSQIFRTMALYLAWTGTTLSNVYPWVIVYALVDGASTTPTWVKVGEFKNTLIGNSQSLITIPLLPVKSSTFIIAMGNTNGTFQMGINLYYMYY